LQDRNKFEILQHKLFHTPYSQEEYSIASRILKGLVESDDVGRAWAWFVQCQMSFSHKVFGGWGTNVSTVNLAKTWCNKLDLKSFCDRLMSTYICCGDAIDCLKKFNSPQSFAYIDPPYIGTSCGHYTGYTEDQYKMLLDFLDKKFEGSFILSGYTTAFKLILNSIP
jgi:DNA adenine methylase